MFGIVRIAVVGLAICSASGAPSTGAVGHVTAPVGPRHWLAPVAPITVGRGFEPPKSTYGPGHRGVDLAAAPGTVVIAPDSGQVVFAGPLAGRGVLSIAIGELHATFEPVSALVRTGQWVTRGDPIAIVQAGPTPGHSPCAGGCLHWGLRTPSGYLDPLLTLGANRVILIPPLSPHP